ncbi:hypothetical protein C9374_005260 [Naegleria lovaniensis]|uniref:Uncharacterized protein n=1 Tax=Naegleria lovaniensis TaxID=51637 RepID=A0AA88GRC4_NAELO|nr:uncharacterized protein C9374_005260 [Naegleria lovaniensis]KAG2382680.1 hypothetical protein C9374_005260 [Naegleria lovaniensis]
MYRILILNLVMILASLSIVSSMVGASLTIFTPLELVYNQYMVQNVLANPNFTLTQSIPNASPFQNWAMVYSGSNVQEVTLGGVLSGNAVKFVGVNNGLSQTVTLNQSTRKVVFFSAWSKAEGVTGNKDSDYSFYIDVRYQDGTSLYGQNLAFDVGTTNWTYKYGFIIPEKPVKSMNAVLLFRNGHTGTAYFSNLVISELNIGADQVQNFDRVVMAKFPNSVALGAIHTLSTSDNLSLRFDKSTGMIAGVTIDSQTVASDSNQIYGGVFIKDMQLKSNESNVYMPSPSKVITTANTFRTESYLSELDLSINTTFKADVDISKTISIRVDVESKRNSMNRALSVYIAIPVSNMNLDWVWGDYLRSSRGIVDFYPKEFNRMSQRISTNQYTSSTPFWGMSTNLTSNNVGLGLGIPLDSPRVVRFSYNAVCKLFYAVIDLGISQLPSAITNKAWIDLVLYKLDKTETTIGNVKTPLPYPARSAAYGYYSRFPQFYQRRISPESEGLWVAFSDITPIPNITDFGISVHEIAYGSSPRHANFGKQKGIKVFRYLTEPFSSWVSLNSTSLDPNNYTQVIDYLKAQAANPNSPIKTQAQYTLVSGIKDPDTGLYRYTSENKPWCPVKCALFDLTPLPNVKPDDSLPSNYISKADNSWNSNVMSDHTNPLSSNFNLSGEYLDSFPANAYLLDYTPDHVKAVLQPILSFDATRPQLVGVVQIFATYYFSKNIGDFLHSIGRYFMTNGASSLGVSWGSDLFDYTGQEMKWVSGGKFVPYVDETLCFSRSNFNQKPYGYLMNIDYTLLTRDIMEQYMQYVTFYGIYPSAFSGDASSNPFWSIPAAYEPNRDLFMKYVPLIKKLNRNGWQVLTGVKGFVNGVENDVVQLSPTLIAPPKVLFERFSVLSLSQEVYITVMITQPVYHSRITLLLDLDMVSNGQLKASDINCNSISAYSLMTKQNLTIVKDGSNNNCTYFGVEFMAIPYNSTWNQYTEVIALSVTGKQQPLPSPIPSKPMGSSKPNNSTNRPDRSRALSESSKFGGVWSGWILVCISVVIMAVIGV